MSKKLEGKVAVVAGGNSGIGLAAARRFVAEGCHVFITGRRQAELDEAVKHIGKNVTGVRGDVFDLADLDRLFATVKQQKGRLDVLFANAGVAAPAPRGKKHATPASASAWYAAAGRARVSSSSIPERQA
jgi:NAD(P)-dependent dehydrogenase (short-subunit alcohol dehydrogenase family)